ncbi:MAG: hypothetical protein WBE68_23150, partial [Candidatus Nitrosopolaris sp.]
GTVPLITQKSFCGQPCMEAAQLVLVMVNQSLRNRDKLKDDAIAHLSDQLMALSTRLQEIERRQQLV